MASNVLFGPIHRKIFVPALCVLSCALFHCPTALAQHVGGHVGGGGHPITAPHVSAPRVFTPPPHPTKPPARIPAGMRGRDPGFRFGPRPIIPFPRRVFFGLPFFRFGFGWGFNSFWWPCGSAWDWGFNCGVPPIYVSPPENYVIQQPYEVPVPVYEYGREERQPVELFLKDGTVYYVTDYWFVNSQIHFTLAEEGSGKSAEQVIGFDELDLNRTIDVNTRHGFRLVMRDEPWEQYLKDHPDLTPPDLTPPPKS